MTGWPGESGARLVTSFFKRLGDSLKRARMRIATAFFSVVLTLVSAVQPVSAAPGNPWMKNLNSGKCALVQGGADNAPVVQFQCLDYPDQRWGQVHKGNGQWQIRNDNSGKCLLARGTGNETPVVQHQCLDYPDQYWILHPYPGHNNWRWVQNVNSGKCLLVRGGSNGTQLVQSECAQYVDQAWSLTYLI